MNDFAATPVSRQTDSPGAAASPGATQRRVPGPDL
jgi:hypothetical protein